MTADAKTEPETPSQIDSQPVLGPATEPEAQTTSITKAGLAVKAVPITRRGRRQKREKKHSTHGSWKLVYADFVTVLMAFFIVCWVILFDNVSKREKIDLSCIKPLSEALQKQIDGEATSKTDKVPLQIDFSVEGLRLTLLDGKEPTFQSGGSKLSEFAKQQFKMIATHVNTCLTHKLKIEGYTDAATYAGGATAYGNWELSAERANSARRELLSQNVDIKRIAQVIGYGDSVPSLPDDPTNALNRRISITVLPPKEKFVPISIDQNPAKTEVKP